MSINEFLFLTVPALSSLNIVLTLLLKNILDLFFKKAVIRFFLPCTEQNNLDRSMVTGFSNIKFQN